MSVIWWSLFLHVAANQRTKAMTLPTDQFWAQQSCIESFFKQTQKVIRLLLANVFWNCNHVAIIQNAYRCG